MFRRDLRGSDTWCGLHNIVLLVMAGVMLMTAEVSAARVSNTFVTIEGDGVISDGSGGVIRDERASGPVTVTARPGWLVNGRESVSFSSAKGLSGGLKFTSRLGEDHSCCPPPPTSNDVHCTDFVIGAMANPSNVVAMYALPTTSAVVTASASSTVVKEGSHHVTMIWKEWECEICHKRQEGRTNEWDYAVSPDRYAWTATAAGLTFGTSTWTGQMSKGLDQGISFDVVGMRMACGRCRSSAHTEATADVHELSVERPDYLGLDLTDAMKGKDVTRTATAKIDPAPVSATYKWTSCGRCKFIGRKDAVDVTYGGNDQTGGSESYLAEPLTVTATAKNAAGQSASASCTTNFTVVAVNVSVGGAGEEGEENSAKEVCYCKDNDDGSLKEFAKANLVPVRITCQPEDLPGIVELAPDSKYAQLFERGKGGSVTLAQTSYPCSEIGKEDFVLHGHSLPDGWLDKAISFFTTDSLTVTHSDSGAIDKGVFKVVPPPPLEITDVQFLSPNTKKNGAWPYDPVWDDDDWKLTVNGISSSNCAYDVDNATVKYTLSRDAKKTDVEFWKDGWPWGSKIDSIVGSAFGGSHEKKWGMFKDLMTGNYYAKVVAVEAETDEERVAESNEGELVRDDYCQSDAHEEELCKIFGHVSLFAQRVDASKRWFAVTVSVSQGAVPFIDKIASAAAAKGVVIKAITATGFVGDWAVNTLTDITTVPDWLREGICMQNCHWMVTKYHWDDDNRKYRVADDFQTVSPAPPLGTGTIDHKHAIFEIGCERYTKEVKLTNGKKDVAIVKEGFYSLEWTTSNAATPFDLWNMHGYKLQEGWSWAEKPYGLKKPTISYESNKEIQE